jgi:hypothetical protein
MPSLKPSKPNDGGLEKMPSPRPPKLDMGPNPPRGRIKPPKYGTNPPKLDMGPNPPKPRTMPGITGSGGGSVDKLYNTY